MNVDEGALEQHAYDLARDHSELLRRLVAIRLKHLSQQEVGERMGGISQPTVSQLERYDANPTLATIRRYAHAIGADISTEVSCRFCDEDHSVPGADQFGWRSLASFSAPALAPVGGRGTRVWSKTPDEDQVFQS